MKRQLLVAGVVTIACVALTAQHSYAGGTITLNDGDDLAAAVADASVPDEIILHKGTYNIAEEITVSRPLTIRGADGTTPDQVIVDAKVDGKYTHRAFSLSGGAVLSGITVTGGYVSNDTTTYGYGAGVIVSGSLTMVTNCVIRENYCKGKGAQGVVSVTSGGFVTHSWIVDNFYYRTGNGWNGGRCVSVYLSAGRINNTLIARNRPYPGSNPDFGTNPSGAIVRCKDGNSGNKPSSLLENCTIVDNEIPARGIAGVSSAGSYSLGVVNTIIVNNSVAGETGVSNSTVEEGLTSIYNSIVDCEISSSWTACSRGDTSVFADYEGGVFELASTAEIAIDKGDRSRDYDPTIGGVIKIRVPKSDISGSSRVIGEEIDIGCYEYDPNKPFVVFDQTAMTGTEPLTVTFTATGERLGAAPEYGWDFDGDGTVDLVTNKNVVVHTFTKGSYPVKLTVRNAETDRTASYAISSPIVVMQATAAFEQSPETGTEPLEVTFVADCPWTGKQPQYSWDFNADGVVDAVTTEPTVQHVYQRGEYAVALYATNLEFGVGAAHTNASFTVAQGITYKADTDWFFEPFGEPLKVTLTGDLGEAPKFYWDVNDDGVAEAITDVPVWRPTLAAGEYHVMVCASNVEAGVGVMIAAEDGMTILPRPRLTVAASDPEVGITGTDIQRTIDAAERGSIVTIPKGTHYTGGIPIAVLKEIELRGATGKAEDVVLHNDTSTNRIMNIDAGPHCLVHSLSMQKGHGSYTTDSSGAHFCAALLVADRKGFNTLANSGSRASAGLGGCVSNVIVRNSSTDGKYSDCSAVYMRGANAIFTHSVISNCSAGAAWDAGLFHAVALVVCEGARGENLLIRGNYSTKSGNSDKASVAVQVRGSGSVLRSSTVTGNTCALCGGVNVCAGGRFELCDIAGNTAYYVTDVARRNVWTAFDFSDNGRPTWTSKVPDPSTFTTEAANAAKESIYSIQTNNAVDVAGCLNETTVYATTAELKPIYRKGAWRLPKGSPAIDVVPAKDVSGMPEKDLNGNRRLVNTLYDLGAFELPNPCGLMLLVK